MLNIKIKNLLLKNGKKRTSEKIFSNTLKKIQKSHIKQATNILRIAIINISPLFKINFYSQQKRKKKQIKEIPVFIHKNNFRVSLAIKLILKNLNKKTKYTDDFLTEEIVSSSKKIGENFLLKNKTQESVLSKKHVLKNYKW
jgi:ribosomal protein S7